MHTSFQSKKDLDVILPFVNENQMTTISWLRSIGSVHLPSVIR